MRKTGVIQALLLAVAACVAVAACGGNAGQNFTGFVQGLGGGARQSGGASQVKSEIVPYAHARFGQDLGFDVAQWPDTPQLKPAYFYAIDGWFGQIEYHTPDERVIVVRVAGAEGPSLTTTYTETHYFGETASAVGGVEVQEGYGEGSCTLFYWQRGNFQFTAHSGRSYAAPSQEEVTALVEGLAAEME